MGLIQTESNNPESSKIRFGQPLWLKKIKHPLWTRV
jgi:hypothetical protein